MFDILSQPQQKITSLYIPGTPDIMEDYTWCFQLNTEPPQYASLNSIQLYCNKIVVQTRRTENITRNFRCCPLPSP